MGDLATLDFRDPITRFLADQTFNVPLGQVLVFTLLLTFCLLLGKDKLGLMISYSFVFYWGFIFNQDHFVSLLGETSIGLYLYGVFGLCMALLALVGMLRK